MTTGEPFIGIIQAIAATPDVARKLLDEHADDGTGRCRLCTSGPQAGHQVWPCRLFGLAEQASKLESGGTR